MPVLGLVTCEVLEDEWAFLLASDPDIDRIVVLENAQSRRFIQTLEAGGCPKIVRIPHISAYRPEPSAGITVIARVLEFALHRNRKVLRQGLAETVREISPHTNALVLGYGLCGNALDHPEEILDVTQPLFMPMDGDHPVDDCVGLLIGGRDRYYAEQCRVPGTFFMTPGWTRHWRRLLEKPDTVTPASLHASLHRVFDRYEQCLLVRTPVMDENVMRSECQPFADLLALRFGICHGTMEIMVQTLQRAKDFLTDGASRVKEVE